MEFSRETEEELEKMRAVGWKCNLLSPCGQTMWDGGPAGGGELDR